MTLPKFILIAPDPVDLPGSGYIAHTGEVPYHIARILKYGSLQEMVEAHSNKPNFIGQSIDGYLIKIVLAGSVEGKIYVSAEGPQKLISLVREMAEWYKERHIEGNSNKFKKYKT